MSSLFVFANWIRRGLLSWAFSFVLMIILHPVVFHFLSASLWGAESPTQILFLVVHVQELRSAMLFPSDSLRHLGLNDAWYVMCGFSVCNSHSKTHLWCSKRLGVCRLWIRWVCGSMCKSGRVCVCVCAWGWIISLHAPNIWNYVAFFVLRRP